MKPARGMHKLARRILAQARRAEAAAGYFARRRLTREAERLYALAAQYRRAAATLTRPNPILAQALAAVHDSVELHFANRERGTREPERTNPDPAYVPRSAGVTKYHIPGIG